jgi:predicted nucleic acid-binding protein
VLSLAEVLVRPLSLEDGAAAADYRYWMENFPNLSLASVDVETVVGAAGLRARYGLRLPDALQLASCLEADVDAFITNDKSLLRVEKPRVLLISDLAAPG